MLARTPRTAHPTESDSQIAASLQAPTFDLSIRQLLASAAAAVTAAILGSRLGVAGTLIGAALASAITMITSAVYSHSLAAAQYRVRQARVSQELETDAETVAIPMPQQAWGLVPSPVPLSIPTTPHAHQQAPPAARDRRLPRWALSGLGALAVCALALLTVTGIEAVRGTPLSGGASGGLSVLGGGSAGTKDTTSTTTVPATDTGGSTSTSSESSPGEGTSATVTSTVTVSATAPQTTSSATTPSTSSPAATTSSTSSTVPTSTSTPPPTTDSTSVTGPSAAP